MVSEVRSGCSRREVARRFRVSLNTVQRWVARAGDQPLGDVDWGSQPPGCRMSSRRVAPRQEDRVLKVRQSLRTRSALGEYGAEAIRRELDRQGCASPPSTRTIGRILERRGALDGRRRQRYKAPPPGWYLTKLAAGQAELDSFDIIEDLVMRGGTPVNVLTGISLHGGLAAAWPAPQITAKTTVTRLIEHWREHGLPQYAKFDNGTVFQGAHHWPDSFGRVTRLCLSLKVTPMFAPPLSRGFQADIEAFNRRWQDGVWSRFTFRDHRQLAAQSVRYIAAHRDRHAARIESAPRRRAFPRDWQLDLQRELKGAVIFIRITDQTGSVSVLGHLWKTNPLWTGRLVRVEVDLSAKKLRIYSLRRKEPHQHTLLATHRYDPPKKHFHE